MEALEEFRQEARTWLDENCPPGMRLPQDGVDGPAWGSPEFAQAAEIWRDRMAQKGWTCPTWPVAFGALACGRASWLAPCQRTFDANPLGALTILCNFDDSV